MATVVQRVADAAARVLLRPATVTAVAAHGCFRTIVLTGTRLAGVDWVAGDKIRVRTDGVTLRTYTPVSWDAEHGATAFIAYAHGDGPGSEWCRTAAAGKSCQLLGPDRSLRLDRLEAPPVFVGDETSLGLLAALRATRPELAPVATMFEVHDADEVRAALDGHGAGNPQLVVRTSADAHLESLAEMTVGSLRDFPDAPLCLTGRAQMISSIRRRLKAEGDGRRAVFVKAYWDVNRKGLD